MKIACAIALASFVPVGLSAGAPPTSQYTIAGLVAQSGGQFDANPNDYDILLNAVQAANLVDALNDPAALLTVLAPSDAAFIRLAQDLGYQGSDEEGTWTFLVGALTALGGGDPIPVLTEVLLYHIVPGRVGVAGFVGGGAAGKTTMTLQGGTFTWRRGELVDQAPAIANPRFTGPLQIRVSNGMIHTIDRVLLPVPIP